MTKLTFIETDADIDELLADALTCCLDCGRVIEPKYCLCERCARRAESREAEQEREDLINADFYA